MLPWIRPEPRPEFAAEAAALLDGVREAIGAGESPGDALKGREIWSGSWKRRGLHKRRLAEPYLPTKCAWCERHRDLSRELDVEHYRPKAKITQWEGNPSTDIKAPPKEVLCDTGYWWLAFRWDNFSLACKTCNQHWKRNLFPVRLPRPSCVEGIEAEERTLLLDPASKFRTRDHFAWDRYNGRIQGVSDEGKATIITCGLNREELLLLRGKTARKTLAAAELLLRAWRMGSQHATTERHRKQVAELTSITAEFTSMTRWIVEEALGVPWENLAL